MSSELSLLQIFPQLTNDVLFSISDKCLDHCVCLLRKNCVSSAHNLINDWTVVSFYWERLAFHRQYNLVHGWIRSHQIIRESMAFHMLLIVDYGCCIFIRSDRLLLLMENNNVINPFVTCEDEEMIGKTKDMATAATAVVTRWKM